LIALFDGLFKFLNVAKHCLAPAPSLAGSTPSAPATARAPSQRARASEALSKAYAIVSELYVSLDHAQYPELCKNLEGLYDFCMQRITHANRHNDVKAIEDVMRVLSPVREAFTTVVKNLAAEEKRQSAKGT